MVSTILCKGFFMEKKWPKFARFWRMLGSRVDCLITNHLTMTKRLFISSSYKLHFEGLKKLLEHQLKLEIIFEVQRIGLIKK